MAVYFYKLVWYKKTTTGFEDGVNITDAVNWDVKKGVKARGASFDIKLKNNWNDYIASSGDRMNQVMIQADDEIKVYADVNPITESPDQLLMVGTVMSFESKIGGKSRAIKIKCSDKSQLILKRIWSKVENSSTAPEIIINTIKQISQEQDEGGFSIDTSNVQKIRPVTNGEGGDDFPSINFAKNMKPIYEWIDELSQIEYTNSDAEQAPGGQLVCQKSFVWFLDENNKLFWFYPEDDVDYTLVHGDDKIYRVKLTKAIWDVINMVIVRGGTDKNGAGVTWYHYDKGSTAELRVKVIPRPRIAELQRQLLIDQDGHNTTLSSDLDASSTTVSLTDASNFSSSGTVRVNTEMIQYDSKSGNDLTSCTRGSFGTGASSSSSGDLVEDATTYGNMSNTAFRTLVKNAIIGVGENITARYGSARWKGSVEVRGAKYTPGEMINLTVKDAGCIAQNLRIIDVHQQMTKSGWFTTLKLEEDETVVGN